MENVKRIVCEISLVIFLINVLTFAFNVAKMPLTYAVEIIDSDHTWKSDTVISASQSVIVKDCALTLADGNVTVYGDLTLQNVHLIIRTVSGRSYLSVSGHGNLTIYNTAMSGPSNYHIYCSDYSKAVIYAFLPEVEDVALVAADRSEVEIYDSHFGNIESRNASKARVIRSRINSTFAFGESIQNFYELMAGHGFCQGREEPSTLKIYSSSPESGWKSLTKHMCQRK